MAEEARRKRCEVLLDLEKVIGDLQKMPEYDVTSRMYDKEKEVFLGLFDRLITELLEMCRME
jgi:hypothetical protein